MVWYIDGGYLYICISKKTNWVIRFFNLHMILLNVANYSFFLNARVACVSTAGFIGKVLAVAAPFFEAFPS